MGRRIVSGGCHLAQRKNGDFAALRRLSPDGEELDGGGAHVRETSSSGPRSKRRLFIASGTLSGGGDSSPSRSWTLVTWKGSDASPAHGSPRLHFKLACRPSWPARLSLYSLMLQQVFFYARFLTMRMMSHTLHVYSRF
ncbi:unnamed protein product [Spirodela intermedia]|uniref:Uncharacterized protein n=1 Tax=Spirodela intermedia TaxID=51605 RepID=A0ABN7ECR2_SPIIN|nr:unnamed protein product [Spirodela intermedia]